MGFFDDIKVFDIVVVREFLEEEKELLNLY